MGNFVIGEAAIGSRVSISSTCQKHEDLFYCRASPINSRSPRLALLHARGAGQRLLKKRCAWAIQWRTNEAGTPSGFEEQVQVSHSMCLLFLSFAFCRKWKSLPIYLSFLSSKSLVLATFLKRIKSWRTNNYYQLIQSLGHAGKGFHCFGQANMVPSLIGSTQIALSWMSFWFLMPSLGMNSWKRWCWGGMPWRWMSHLARHCLHLFACYAFKIVEMHTADTYDTWYMIYPGVES